MPRDPLPIVIFGAGSIVRDAHIPAYEAVGLPISGVYDPDIGKAEAIGQTFNVPVFPTIEEAASKNDAILDLATPPAAHLEVLKALPEGAFAVMQKPMGSTLQDATAILNLCRARNLQACVNFQLLQ